MVCKLHTDLNHIKEMAHTKVGLVYSQGRGWGYIKLILCTHTHIYIVHLAVDEMSEQCNGFVLVPKPMEKYGSASPQLMVKPSTHYVSPQRLCATKKTYS